jgi:hypothetical protein
MLKATSQELHFFVESSPHSRPTVLPSESKILLHEQYIYELDQIFKNAMRAARTRWFRISHTGIPLLRPIAVLLCLLSRQLLLPCNAYQHRLQSTRGFASKYQKYALELPSINLWWSCESGLPRIHLLPCFQTTQETQSDIHLPRTDCIPLIAVPELHSRATSISSSSISILARALIAKPYNYYFTSFQNSP